MDKYIVDKLMEYIDAKIDYLNARDSSDGGLIESVKLSTIRIDIEKYFE